MLQYALQASGDPSLGVVRSTLVAAVALALKRGWQTEAPESRAKFLQVRREAEDRCVCAVCTCRGPVAVDARR